ncbi:MAG: helix-turn-helix transcriptional regulator [Pseudomonadota bacterium]|nr:helix-turn-helix transcriptional regulator [Pseudomonadota bacterium]
MPRTFHTPFPSITKQLTALGERLREARLRRELTTVLFAERLGVSRDTLSRLEKGDPNIAIGTYMKALRVLGLDQDIDQVAKDDIVGRKLQDRALAPHRNANGTVAKEAVARLRLARTATLKNEKNTRERNQETLSQLLKKRLKGEGNGET